MTDRADENPKPRTRRGGLFVNDAELIEKLGVPEKIAREAIQTLDADRRSGFPKKQQLWGDRRYWPAVRAYLDATNGLKSALDAARSAAESRDRTRLPHRHSLRSPAEGAHQ